jgi:hypothetical protein
MFEILGNTIHEKSGVWLFNCIREKSDGHLLTLIVIIRAKKISGWELKINVT